MNLDRALAFLTPYRRQAIYRALFAIGTVLVISGVVTDSLVVGIAGLVDAVLAAVALGLASWKAKRLDMTLAYAAVAAIVVAFKALGIVQDGQASHYLDILSAVFATVGPLVAAIRTSTATPTGEPVEEYIARHGDGEDV